MKIVKIIVTIVGVLAILMGLVWILQGTNVLPGSFMSGQSQWTINGTITLVIGICLIAGANWDRIRKQ